MKNNTKALLYTLSCVGLWALIPVVSRFGQATLDNYQFLFWSSVLSFLVLLSSTIASKKTQEFAKYSLRQVGIAFGLGFLGTFLYYVLLYYGYANGVGLEVLVIQYMWPILIVFFSWLILREKITTSTIISICMGFVGVVLVLTKGNLHQIQLTNVSVSFVVLIAAMSFALFSVLSKKVEYEPFSVTTLFFLSAIIFSTLSLFTYSSFEIPQSLSEWAMIVINGAFINGLSYVLWLQALKYGNASVIASLVFLTPVLSAVLIVLLFNEPFYSVYIIGLIAVVGAGLVSQTGKSNS